MAAARAREMPIREVREAGAGAGAGAAAGVEEEEEEAAAAPAAAASSSFAFSVHACQLLFGHQQIHEARQTYWRPLQAY